MARLFQALLRSAVPLLCLAVEAQSGNTYIVAARRGGVVEFIESATLKTLGSIRLLNVASNGAGLNGVFADPDENTIYVEGPTRESSVCCWLYAIDLATLRTSVVAGIWGTRSRRAFIDAGPGSMRSISPAAASSLETPERDQWQASPDGRWWIGLRNGPALDVYDVARKEITRSLVAPGGDQTHFSRGAWLDNRFYVYAMDHETGRLWMITPQSTQLGNGRSLPEANRAHGCMPDAPMNIAAAGNRLFLFEIFGSKVDSREQCGDVPGGAWAVDPTTGRVLARLAADLHFFMLVPNHDGSELYGITSEAPQKSAAPRLVRLDAQSSKVLESRVLESDYWWIAVAPLKHIPTGNVSASLASY